MPKVSLRDFAREQAPTPTPGVKMTRAEQNEMIQTLRQQTLSRIKAISMVETSTKSERFDRIVEVLAGHSVDVTNILRYPQVVDS